jgi:hypothetical protein
MATLFLILVNEPATFGATQWQLVEVLHYKPEGRVFDSP